MEMFRTYTDYVNKTAITIPDKFIDVKTGESIHVTARIQEQIEYHSNNQTLVHLILSALNSYLQPRSNGENSQNALILDEINEIKRLLQKGYIPLGTASSESPVKRSAESLDLNEVEDVLEAFGG
jgi:hypothetical protein